jgi:intracellular sulfur oxidation DsrE/DsrF family protein
MNNRRSFLTRAGSIAAFFGFAGSGADAQTAAPSAAPSSGRWQPVRDPKDDWYDIAGSKRRIFFDCTSPNGVVDGAQFAGNFFTGNKDGYSIEANELAVIVGFRHNATCWGYNEAMWNKYGKVFSDNAGPWTDPKTGEPATTNIRKTSLENLAKRGVQFTLCNLSTRRFSSAVARATNQKQDDVYKEIGANLMPNARLVPAGIVAVDRAQEHGYSIAYVG